MPTSPLLPLVCAAGILVGVAPAQSPFLVKDIRPGPSSSSPGGFTEWNGQLLFSARTDAEGRELWVSDGTAAGTQMIVEVQPGPGSGVEGTFLEFQGALYFYGNDGVHGREVWRTDGTAGGTWMLFDFEPGPDGSNALMRLFGGQLYIAATTTADGRELYTTDGTTGGTVKFVDINPGPADGFGWFAHTDGAYMIFGADDGVHGYEPWVSDGTPGGTQLLADCFPGPGLGFSSNAYPWKNLCFFTAKESGNNIEPWVTDGTPAGTQLLLDVEPGPGPSFPVLYNSAALDSAFLFEATTTAEGSEPWVTDGTPAGTHLLVDLEPGPDDSRPDFSGEVGGSVAVFGASSPATGYEPWISDGTAAGTVVAEINPGPTFGADDFFFHAVDRVFFLGWTPDTGYEMGSSDGTVAGTAIFGDVANASNSGASVNFADDTLVIYNLIGQMVYSNGLAEWTHELALDPDLAAFDYVQHAKRVGDYLFIQASDTNGPLGSELYAVEYDVDGDGTFGWLDELNVVPSCFCDSSAPCGNIDSGAGCASSTGLGARLDGTGTTILTKDDLVLTVSGVPRNQFGVLFMGPSFAASVPLGDGLRCVSGALRRWNAKNAGATGELVYGPGLAAQAESMFPDAYHFLPGHTWSFQAWYRDPNGPCGTSSNVSSAVRVTFTP